MKLRSKFAFVLSSLAMLASFLVCALILGVTADVIVRNLFSRTIRGIDELSEYMLLLYSLAACAMAGVAAPAHSIDLVLNFLSQRAANRAGKCHRYCKRARLRPVCNAWPLLGDRQRRSRDDGLQELHVSGMVAVRPAAGCHGSHGSGFRRAVTGSACDRSERRRRNAGRQASIKPLIDLSWPLARPASARISGAAHDERPDRRCSPFMRINFVGAYLFLGGRGVSCN